MNNMIPDLENLPGKAQKQILVVPIIDSSKSMEEKGNIGKVNEAMREMAPQLVAIENANNVDILLAPIIFNNGASWVGLDSNGNPQKADSFNWFDVTASGGTDMGVAFGLLTQKLTTKENGGWLDGRKGLRPILLLISDGAPTDMWEMPLKMLSRRGWFKVAMKFAIAVEDANISVLEKFTGNNETIYNTDSLRTDLASLVKVIILEASQAVSDTGGLNPEDTAAPTQQDADDIEKARIAKNINDIINDNEAASAPTDNTDNAGAGDSIDMNNDAELFDDDNP